MGTEQGGLGSLTVFSKEDFEDEWLRVASGGFGHVYQVKHRRWRTVYAVKCSPYLLQDSSVDRTSMNCLMEEASKMEKIKFQHIVTIYGVCNSPLGIVMEYMARGSLERILPTHRMSWQLKFRVIHEMGLAMNFLHSMSPPLLHLDLKPGNVLLDGNMHVKISDFGLSKWMEQSSRMQYIESSALRGTLSYIPPEMFLQNSKPPGIKYDVYSFSIVIWEVLMQKKPYTGANMMAIIVKVAAGKRPGLELVRDDWPGECHQMVDLMKRCWDQDPKQRPSFADIPVETDVLLALIQSLVQDPENERLVRKMSHKPAISRSQQGDREEFTRSGGKDPQEVPLPPPQGEAGSPEELCPEELGRVQENGLTPLHLLVLQGHAAKVRSLLGRGAGANVAAGGGCTPLLLALHLAAQNNFENVARVLLSRQADPNAQEVDGKTALHVAAGFGHVGLVKLLASQGADLERKQKNLRTPLHVAVERGKFRVVQYLLKNGISVNSLDQNHYSALHLAVVRGKYLICEKLIKYGANVELRTDKGWTPLHLASFKGHIEIIRLLKGSRARLDAKGGMDWTPLHLATRYGDEPVVSELLRCGADPNTTERSRWAPLHFAVLRGSFLSVINLLECRADVNARNKVGRTPLHLAVLKGNVAIVKTLLKAGALLDVEDITGCTALQLAVRHQRENIITLLQGKEASGSKAGNRTLNEVKVPRLIPGRTDL
ncbi:ankyrin repeat and protein kinase domain-containing protein 1 [Geospiza fortis]|uniref:Ankyrin repeat and protein kinase domain-containing protein 1 n=1 Tax=Geospiza fortis TaxID=48883 RepID=A0A8N5HVL1_GEOFO|nr:ankyrin repeat and protein kinase domain-containing protein 1 [Geospiza fortis]